MHSHGVTTPPTHAQVAPPELLHLVGHPLRWRLLGALGESDLTVQELTARVDQAQNLVSYHLAKLRAAGLVRSHRSAADARDAYYTADLARIGAQLAATAGALHPGLGSPPPRDATAAGAPVRVLFLCTGNSARSQMAEALAVHRSDGRVEARSAGSHPKPLHPDAVRVMRTGYALDISGWESKHLDGFAHDRFDWVITLCDRVREVCPTFPGASEPVHWSIPDPATATDAFDATDGPADPFARTAAELDRRITFWLAVATSRTASAPSQ